MEERRNGGNDSYLRVLESFASFGGVEAGGEADRSPLAAIMLGRRCRRWRERGDAGGGRPTLDGGASRVPL